MNISWGQICGQELYLVCMQVWTLCTKAILCLELICQILWRSCVGVFCYSKGLLFRRVVIPNRALSLLFLTLILTTLTITITINLTLTLYFQNNKPFRIFGITRCLLSTQQITYRANLICYVHICTVLMWKHGTLLQKCNGPIVCLKLYTDQTESFNTCSLVTFKSS